VRLVTFQSRGAQTLGAVEGSDVFDLGLAYARPVVAPGESLVIESPTPAVKTA
jgi:hypothetical protein